MYETCTVYGVSASPHAFHLLQHDQSLGVLHIEAMICICFHVESTQSGMGSLVFEAVLLAAKHHVDITAYTYLTLCT